MTRPTISPLLVLLLAMLTGLDALAIDIHLPAFAALAKTFDASETRMALTLSAFLLGLALGQLVWAPLLEALGRRRPALAGVGLFVAASIFCATTGSFEALLAGRLVQGLGAAVAIMLPRVVVADLCDEAGQARIHSTLMQVFLVVPVLAPLLGGAMYGLTGWRGLFWLLGAAGSPVRIGAGLRLPGPYPVSCPRTILYGIGGSFVGGLVGRLLNVPETFSFVLSVACAAGLIWYFTRRNKTPAA